MKFVIEARDDAGNLGKLTVVRRGNVLEYWSFEKSKVIDVETNPVQLELGLPRKPWASTSEP